jgi:hypothetical protein
MKRVLLALLLAALAYFLALASAATLNVQNSSLGAGSGTASSCDPDVTTSYTTSYTTGSGYVVTQVVVGSLDTTACNGKTVQVTLTDGSNNSLGNGSLTVPGSGTSATVPISGSPAAASVAKAVLVIG